MIIPKKNKKKTNEMLFNFNRIILNATLQWFWNLHKIHDHHAQIFSM